MTAPAITPPVRGVIDRTLDRPATAPLPKKLEGPRAFLQSEHEIHAEWAAHWRWLEKAMKGGRHIRTLLRRFDWEVENGDSIVQRQRTATYVNWPYLFASTIAGFLTRSAPVPDYGPMGKITAAGTPVSQQTRADLFHYNVDGSGSMGTEWNAWWEDREISAQLFGFTWIHEEAPGESRLRTGTAEQERRGIRPYLVEWTPLSVWDWHFGPDRQLEYAIIRFPERVVKQDGSAFSSVKTTRYYLHVRRGWGGFGDEYKAGGFWLYDDKGNIVTRKGVEVQGNYDSLDGEIPIHPLFFIRDKGTDDTPSIARSGVEDLAAMAEAYMNLSSARDFEVWDSAKGMEYFLGLGKDAFNLAMDKIGAGSRMVPIATDATHPNPTVVPSSMGVVPSEVFQGALDAKRADAAEASGMQQVAGPDASGVSRETDFASAKSPVLARFAAEIQSCQNTAIYNIQKRFGIPHSQVGGGVVWPRKFELIRLAEALQRVFDAAVAVGAKSPTLFATGIVKMAKDEGAVTDEATATKIEQEIRDGMTADADAARAVLAARTAPRATPPAPSLPLTED